MGSKLGVLSEGPARLGYPFHKLFTDVKRIDNLQHLKDVDAVVLWGGTDISPFLYGEKPNNFNEAGELPSKRDSFEWSVLDYCNKNLIPIIGVCRGAQLMCVYDGGKLIQDVGGHGRGHYVVDIEGKKSFYAAASHHQMMLPKANTVLIATAEKRLADFYIGENNAINQFDATFREPEAVFFPDIRGIGFQFHPEWADENDFSVKWSLDKVKEYLL